MNNASSRSIYSDSIENINNINVIDNIDNIENTDSVKADVFKINNLNIHINSQQNSTQHSNQNPKNRDNLVHALNWSIKMGERWVILGANGCGKSSLLHAAAGLSLAGRTASYDAISFGNHTFTPKNVCLHTLAKLRSYCPQRLDWNVQLTPIQLANLLNIDMNATAFIAADLPRVWLHQAIAKRSGGEQQRIALALSLAHSAPIVFLDEPLSHLDEVQQMHTLDLLKHSGKTIVMVSHHIRLSLAFATHVLMPAKHTNQTQQHTWLAGVCYDVVNVDTLAAAYCVDAVIAQELMSGFNQCP